MIRPEIRAYAKASLERSGAKPVLVVSGPTGTGKTRSAKIILRWWGMRMSYLRAVPREKIVFAEMVFAMSMVDPSRSLATLFVAGGSFTEAREAAAEIGRMVRPDLLIVDDLGREPKWCPADTMSSGLCDLLDARVEARRNTILTTNLTGKEIGNRYGARLRSRLLGSADVVYLTGKDWRANK